MTPGLTPLSSNNVKNAACGLLLIISGPSGSGKSTLVRQLVETGEFPITFSVSATSRAPRPGEVDGKDYHFLTRERFDRMVDEKQFLEHAQVHGNGYGTPREPALQALSEGRWVLLEIDVEGHRQVKALMPEACSFFIRAPSVEQYDERLRRRGADSEEAIARRVADARAQLTAARDYDFQVVNETVEQASRTLRTLLWGLKELRGTHHAG